jgi:hypothetical protein
MSTQEEEFLLEAVMRLTRVVESMVEESLWHSPPIAPAKRQAWLDEVQRARAVLPYRLRERLREPL